MAFIETRGNGSMNELPSDRQEHTLDLREHRSRKHAASELMSGPHGKVVVMTGASSDINQILLRPAVR